MLLLYSYQMIFSVKWHFTEHPSVATLVDIADALCISIDDLLIDSLHYSVSTSNTELHRLLLDCNETE